MIAIIVSITVSLSILLSAFISFSPSFKALIEGGFKRKAQESAWAYAAKSGQLIERANSRDNPPGSVTCPGATSTAWTCEENLPMRYEQQPGGAWNSVERICVKITLAGDKITVVNVVPTPNDQACP